MRVDFHAFSFSLYWVLFSRLRVELSRAKVQYVYVVAYCDNFNYGEIMGNILALRRLVWNTTISFSQRRCERMGGQVLEFGHAQVGDADEVRRGSVAPCGPFGLLQ